MLVLDMDGVLVNFCKAAYAVHGVPHNKHLPTSFDFFKDWGMTAAEFWGPIDDKGAEFWANLEKYPWTDTIIEMAKDWPSGFMVATACSLSHHSAAGKVEAIKALFGNNFRDYALFPRKWHLAQPGYVLLDDHEENCEEWEIRKGRAILFPQPWNKNRYLAYEAMRMEWVVEQLTEALLEDPEDAYV